ncbi:MAG: ATP-binding protein [Granulicella sp.]
MRRQIQQELAQDLDHSVLTFVNLQRQQRELLRRESALLADLPSLKALMTTHDAHTLEDGGLDFWKVSGSDLFQLYEANGHLVASYTQGSPIARRIIEQAMQPVLQHAGETDTVVLGDRLFEVAAQPLTFGASPQGTVLGYVIVGYAIDDRLAREVSDAAAAQVAFTLDGRILVSTLGEPLESVLRLTEPFRADQKSHLRVGKEDYLLASIPLENGVASGVQIGERRRIRLIVLKSYDQASRFLTEINEWILGLGALAMLTAGLFAMYLSRQFTRPLEALVEGTRALGRGEFETSSPVTGTTEVVELSQAFDRMRVEIETQQQRLLYAERLATIGRMASSISHDLRHYLSAMYANAEFLSLAGTPQKEREELLREVQAAVYGMTDLLDSLIVFSQTGNALHPELESLNYVSERAASLVRSHPSARKVDLRIDDLPTIEAFVDGKMIGRAIFNLLLNACQAAQSAVCLSRKAPLVGLTLEEDSTSIFIRVTDNGRGVPLSIRDTLFQPFVSRDKEDGTGLGLTLAQHIAQEHGGLVQLDASVPGCTRFSIVLSKHALTKLQERNNVMAETRP